MPLQGVIIYIQCPCNLRLHQANMFHKFCSLSSREFQDHGLPQPSVVGCPAKHFLRDGSGKHKKEGCLQMKPAFRLERPRGIKASMSRQRSPSPSPGSTLRVPTSAVGCSPFAICSSSGLFQLRSLPRTFSIL